MFCALGILESFAVFVNWYRRETFLLKRITRFQSQYISGWVDKRITFLWSVVFHVFGIMWSLLLACFVYFFSDMLGTRDYIVMSFVSEVTLEFKEDFMEWLVFLMFKSWVYFLVLFRTDVGVWSTHHLHWVTIVNFCRMLDSEIHVFTFGFHGWFLHFLCGQLSQHYCITLTSAV